MSINFLKDMLENNTRHNIVGNFEYYLLDTISSEKHLILLDNKNKYVFFASLTSIELPFYNCHLGEMNSDAESFFVDLKNKAKSIYTELDNETPFKEIYDKYFDKDSEFHAFPLNEEDTNKILSKFSSFYENNVTKRKQTMINNFGM